MSRRSSSEAFIPLLRHWGILELRPRTARAARAQAALAADIEHLEQVVARSQERRALRGA